MRRRPVLFAPALALSVGASLAACSGGSGDIPVKVTGGYGQRPEVEFPDGSPGAELATSTLVQGKGAQVRAGDLVVANYAGYRWNASGNKLVTSSFTAGVPGAFPAGRLVPGLDRALAGRRAGSRVVAVIPPKEGYGAKGDSRHQIGPQDSIVYVMDVLATYPHTAAAGGTPVAGQPAALPKVGTAAAGQAPPVTVPHSAPPRALKSSTVVRGTGPAVKSGRLAVLQFTSVLWRNGKEFYSTWNTTKRPTAVVIGSGQTIKAFDEGLVGKQVGSRVLLVAPPKWGYGGKGLKQYGIKSNDTLVYVVDILGAY